MFEVLVFIYESEVTVMEAGLNKLEAACIAQMKELLREVEAEEASCREFLQGVGPKKRVIRGSIKKLQALQVAVARSITAKDEPAPAKERSS